MTPRQIALVEETMATLDLDALAADVYRRLLAAEPALAALFPSDPATQRARFAAELAALVRLIRIIRTFELEARSLGTRHHGYGVRPAHYRVMGTALLTGIGTALAEEWTPEVEEAWGLAYNLTAELMMTGALEGPWPR